MKKPSRFKFIRKRKLRTLIYRALAIETAIDFLQDGINDFNKFMIKSWDETNLLHEDYYVKRANGSLDATQYILKLANLSSRMDKLEEIRDRTMSEIEEYYDQALSRFELRAWNKVTFRRFKF